MQDNRYRHPTPGMMRLLLEPLLNSVSLRRVLRMLPMVQLKSDVRDVVYLNWLIPEQRVAAWECERIKIKRWGEFVPLTVLTYKHHHFGPRMLGPMRACCLSPLQSNWRFYIESIDGESQTETHGRKRGERDGERVDHQ